MTQGPPIADAWVEHGRGLAIEGAAGGPLAGLDFAVKDLFDVAGLPTGAGSPGWLATHGPAAASAPVVETLLAAGATLRGKTQTDELAYGLMGINAHYGAPLNGNAPERVPGGSSSGSASAVSSGLVDFALGTDTGGSVRVPASFCGLFGLRTTHGAVPTAGVVPLAASYDTVGWFARDPETMERVADVLLPPERPRADIRPLLTETACWRAADAETAAALEPALARLAGLLGEPRAVEVAPDGLAAWYDTFRSVQGFEAWRAHGAWIEGAKPDLEPNVVDRFAAASQVTEAEATAASARREEIRASVCALLGGDAALCLPTAPVPPPRRDAPEPVIASARLRTLEFTCIAGLCRLPQLSIPAGTVGDAPVGLSLIGPPGSDRALIRLAARLWEALRG